MDLMLNLILLSTKSSTFLVQIILKRLMHRTVIILHRHGRRKPDVKFVNDDIG